MPQLTQEQKRKIHDTLIGTSGINDNAVCEEYGLELEDLEELCEELELKRYADCEWWTETDELADDDEDDEGRCESCR